jgi:hypothetical protein
VRIYLCRDDPGPRLDAGIWGLLRIIPWRGFSISF